MTLQKTPPSGEMPIVSDQIRNSPADWNGNGSLDAGELKHMPIQDVIDTFQYSNPAHPQNKEKCAKQYPTVVHQHAIEVLNKLKPETRVQVIWGLASHDNAYDFLASSKNPKKSYLTRFMDLLASQKLRQLAHDIAANQAKDPRGHQTYALLQKFGSDELRTEFLTLLKAAAPEYAARIRQVIEYYEKLSNLPEQDDADSKHSSTLRQSFHDQFDQLLEQQLENLPRFHQESDFFMPEAPEETPEEAWLKKCNENKLTCI